MTLYTRARIGAALGRIAGARALSRPGARLEVMSNFDPSTFARRGLALSNAAFRPRRLSLAPHFGSWADRRLPPEARAIGRAIGPPLMEPSDRLARAVWAQMNAEGPGDTLQFQRLSAHEKIEGLQFLEAITTAAARRGGLRRGDRAPMNPPRSGSRSSLERSGPAAQTWRGIGQASPRRLPVMPAIP